MADSNPVDVFSDVQSAAMGEIQSAQGADGQYATEFRPAASVVSGSHMEGVTVGFSDAQEQSFDFFHGYAAGAQAAINAGKNGVEPSDYTNYANSTGDA